MMEDEADAEFHLVPGTDPTTGAAIAAAAAVCVTCRMLISECECQPRTRKKQVLRPDGDVTSSSGTYTSSSGEHATCLPCTQQPDRRSSSPAAKPSAKTKRKPLFIPKDSHAEEVYNNSILGFLKTNRFQIRVPGMSVDEHIPGDLGDFVGLNYYSHLLLSPFMKTEPPFEVLSRPGDIETDFPYCTYPEGFYRALMQIHEVGLPIYVTENGIPDAKDDRRADFITRYLYAMKRAMDDGADVRGFYYWSLLDNFEWAEGYTMRFGIFEVDFETQERRLREGARPLLEHL